VSLQDFQEALSGKREHPTVSAFKRDYPLANEHLSGMNALLSADGRGRIDIDASPDEQGVILVTLTNERTKQKTSVKWFTRHDAIIWSNGRVSHSYPRVLGPSYQEHGERDRFIRSFNRFASDFFNG
jgi:hypothetical protein